MIILDRVCFEITIIVLIGMELTSQINRLETRNTHYLEMFFK